MTAAPGQGDPAHPGTGRRAGPLVVDVGALRPGHGSGAFGVLAALARMRLAARRTGYVVRLRGVTPELRHLLEQTGLAGEFEWEPEEREEVRGVEE